MASDTSAGLVKRNEHGQVVLSTGNFVPSIIAGDTLRERVQEYYRQHPRAHDAPAVQHMLFEPVNLAAPATPEPTFQYMVATDYPRPVSASRGLIHGLEHHNGLFQQLEHKMYASDRRRQPPKPAPVVHNETRADRAHRRAAQRDEPEERAISLPPPATHTERLPDAPAARASEAPIASENARTNGLHTAAAQPAPMPEHPFRDVRDATYAPPTQRNFGLPPVASQKPTAVPRRNDAAYKSFVPVYGPKHAINVYRRCLEARISITQEELLALAPEIRNATREACSTRRVPVDGQDTGDTMGAAGARRAANLFADMPASYSLAVVDDSLVQTDHPPPGSLVIDDPLDCLLKAGQVPPPLKTSTSSLSIRAIEGTFQNQSNVACILDSGSAIVSMSEGLCNKLGLAFDPSVVLHMQSANGELNPSLGLARNVPVRFGSIVVYFQFHVIRSPAYDVLLGRPFDILTKSIVQIFDDGSQTITLHDPNSSVLTEVPTLPRRPPEFAKPLCVKAEDFRDSRNRSLTRERSRLYSVHRHHARTLLL